ncbi:MAG: radical SAM/SPASM domain-containing protein, partial [Candidatus Syntropharchaeia archaeon]
MKRKKGFMSMKIYRKVIEVQELPNLVLHGFGEPLLHPKLDKFIKLGKDKGFRVEFSTNGLLLDRKRMERLSDAGVDEVRISIRPFFDKVVKNIETFYDEFSDRLKILYIEYPEKRKPLPKGWDVTAYPPHNWAGQVNIPTYKQQSVCNPMKLRAVTVLWDGRVSNCCQDCEGEYILGTLDDKDLYPRRIPL